MEYFEKLWKNFKVGLPSKFIYLYYLFKNTVYLKENKIKSYGILHVDDFPYIISGSGLVKTFYAKITNQPTIIDHDDDYRRRLIEISCFLPMDSSSFCPGESEDKNISYASTKLVSTYGFDPHEPHKLDAESGCASYPGSTDYINRTYIYMDEEINLGGFFDNTNENGGFYSLFYGSNGYDEEESSLIVDLESKYGLDEYKIEYENGDPIYPQLERVIETISLKIWVNKKGMLLMKIKSEDDKELSIMGTITASIQYPKLWIW